MAIQQTHESASKTARLEARVTEAQKALIQRAAALSGRSLTDFVVSSTHEAAVRTVRDYESMTLNAQDSEVFVAAILNAPEPGSRLRKAARRYKASMDL